MTQTVFPQGWIEQLRPLLGQELPDFLLSYDSPPARGLRMRRDLPPPAEAEEKVPWAENAYYLPLDSQAGAAPLHEAGAYYLQEPSAMAAAAALRPLPGDRVLDLCAAPGGKTTQMASMLGGQGLLVCNEPVPSRCQVLSRNVERMGVPNAVVVSALPEELCRRWPGFFDKILVDAPCSGEGMFRRHPETRLEWTPASPAGCAQRQLNILRCAALMLRPGGIMAYSTCTFNDTENEGVIARFLREEPAFSLLPFSLPGLGAGEGMLRLWPHRVRGEGHFVALLRREGDAPAVSFSPSDAFPRPGKEEMRLCREFSAAQTENDFAPNAVFAGRLVMAPEGLPPLKGVRVLRLGLQLGEMKGKVFSPDHALALACRPRNAFPLSPEEARAYLSGQVLPCADGLRGYCALTLDNWVLGWGKASGGQIKNHYPRGLRRPVG